MTPRPTKGTKLTKLGSEGRSTSTTITAFSILNQLDDAGFKPEDQKLLSFTDNRQDAALAGRPLQRLSSKWFDFAPASTKR
jgi:hypothetical protein